MDIYTILATIFKYGLVALGGIAVLIPLYLISFMIYKKVFHGTKKLQIGQWISLILLSAWLILVLGLTTFSRGANFDGSINLSMFSGYINAWHEWSYTELQLIIFNMLMFAPLGFFIPLLMKRGENFSFVCIVSFLIAFFIEVLQLLTGRGIFELDDLFHNFLGSIFGYFIIMFLITCYREKQWKWKPFIKMMVLPLIYTIGIFGAIIIYQNQEYGNMPIIPAEKQDMSLISIQNETTLSKNTEKAGIYKNPVANDKEYHKNISKAVEELLDINFKSAERSEGKNRIYEDSNSTAQLTVFTNSGEWTLTTWSSEKSTMTSEKIEERKDYLEAWLKKYNLLPDNTTFYVQNNSTLRWDSPITEKTDPQQDYISGSIMIDYDNNGNISNIHYFIIQNEYVKSVEIISKKDAYAEILDGNFEQYPPFEKGDNIIIDNCILSYEYDTKGFYRPVYKFSGYINQEEYIWEGIVSTEK